MLDLILHFLFGGPTVINGTPVASAWVFPAIMAGTSLYNLWQGSKDRSRANKRADRAVQLGEQRYNETAPFRAIALNRLQNAPQQRTSLNDIFADPSNPFYRPNPQPGASPGGAPQAPIPSAPVPPPGRPPAAPQPQGGRSQPFGRQDIRSLRRTQ